MKDFKLTLDLSKNAYLRILELWVTKAPNQALEDYAQSFLEDKINEMYIKEKLKK